MLRTSDTASTTKRSDVVVETNSYRECKMPRLWTGKDVESDLRMQGGKRNSLATVAGEIYSEFLNKNY